MEIINDILKTNDIYTTINNLSIKDLEDTITYASEKYYNEEPIIDDAIFDMMREFLYLKAPKSKILKQVGAITKSKDKVKLPYYLGSMDKIKPPSNKLYTYLQEYEPPYIATDKLDGVSALIVYKDNTISLYTRGTATHGQDITKLLQYIKVPSYDDVMTYLTKHKLGNTIALRGELIIPKIKFETNWLSVMKNARNAVAGLVNSKHIDPTLAHDTHMTLYQIVEPLMCMSNMLRIIKELGFKTVHHKIFNKLDYMLLSKYLLKRRTKSKYMIDGIIITNDMIHPENTDGNPDYAWAFKDVLEDQKAKSHIIDIEWNQSKDGNIIPTLIIEPVDVGGVSIKRITGNNARYVVDNMLGIGALVEVIRSNDVIPKIEKVIKGAHVKIPNGKWDINGVHIIHTNMKSDNIIIKNIYYFFNTIGTVGLGEKVIERIYNAGYITILDFIKLKIDDLILIDGFKMKSAENIINAIKTATTNIPLAIFMKASNKLGRGMGHERAKDVLERYPNIMTEYTKYTEKQFIDMLKIIDGWEEKTSTLFAKNFKHFIEFYNSIKKYISIETHMIVKHEGVLSGMKIVMSGFRDKDLEILIENNGGTISSGVSKNTNILIVKDDVITSKILKAKELGIMIHNVDEFHKMYKLGV